MREQLLIAQKYWVDFLLTSAHRLVGGRSYQQWQQSHYGLKDVKLASNALSHELEEACLAQSGSLTFSEYLKIDQFGSNGYHSRYRLHGKTPVDRTWGEALAKLCQNFGLHEIIEFGPGDGALALKAITTAQKSGYQLFFSGIEINERLQRRIRQSFTKAGLNKSIKVLTKTLKDIKKHQACLLVLAYSLDSLPPEMLVNQSPTPNLPDSLIGIKVSQRHLQEKILSFDELGKRGIELKGGHLTYRGFYFDLSQFILAPEQRACLPLDSFVTLTLLLQNLPLGSVVLIVDEFEIFAPSWIGEHRCLPRDLHRYDRTLSLSKLYTGSGSNLLYYTTYFNTLANIVFSLGIDKVFYDREETLAAAVLGKSVEARSRLTSCYAILFVKENEIPKNPTLLVGPPESAGLDKRLVKGFSGIDSTQRTNVK